MAIFHSSVGHYKVVPPPVISWFITLSNYCEETTINPSEFVAINQLNAKYGAPPCRGYILLTIHIRLQQAQAVELHRIHGPKQGRLLVDALAKVGHEGTGNVEALVHDLGIS